MKATNKLNKVALPKETVRPKIVGIMVNVPFKTSPEAIRYISKGMVAERKFDAYIGFPNVPSNLAGFKGIPEKIQVLNPIM